MVIQQAELVAAVGGEVAQHPQGVFTARERLPAGALQKSSLQEQAPEGVKLLHVGSGSGALGLGFRTEAT